MISCADLLCSGKLAFVVVPAAPAWGYYETSVHGLIYGDAGSAGMGVQEPDLSGSAGTEVGHRSRF